jgi:hypothetical protein
MTAQHIAFAVAIIVFIVVIVLPLTALTKIGCFIGISVAVGYITRRM